MPKGSTRSNTKVKGKVSEENERSQKPLEEGEIDDEDFFNLSMECESDLNPEDDDKMQKKEFGEENDGSEEEEQETQSKKYHKRLRRKHKSLRSTVRKSRHKKRKSESISESNDSPPSHKMKKSEKYLQIKKHKVFLENDSRIERSSKSSFRGRNLHLVKEKSKRMSRPSCHTSGSSHSRTGSPFLPSSEMLRKRSHYSSESDSCYSDLEMQLKQCRECTQNGPSRSGSKCEFLDDPEYHLKSQRNRDSFHSSDNRISPPSQPLIHYPEREPVRHEFIDARTRGPISYEDRRPKFCDHPHTSSFHRQHEIQSHTMRDDLPCRPIPSHHDRQQSFRLARGGEPRWNTPQDHDSFDKIENSQNQQPQQRLVAPFPPTSSGDISIQRHSGFGPSPQEDNLLKRNSMAEQSFLSSQQGAGFKPTSAFHENLAAHIREQNWMGASRLLFLRMANDRNPQTCMPPPFSMPISTPGMTPGGGIMPIPDSHMIRPMPIANFPSLPGMFPMPPRSSAMIPPPPVHGMPPMLPPAMRGIPPPWMPHQLLMNQPERLKFPMLSAPSQSVNPTSMPSAITPTEQNLDDSSSIEPKKENDATVLANKNEDDTAARKEQNTENVEDTIPLDDPDVINMSSDLQKMAGDDRSTEKCRSDAIQLASNAEAKTKLTEGDKSEDTWTYSSDDDTLFPKTQKSPKNEVISESVQSIMQMISKKKNTKNTNVDSHLLSKVANVISFSPITTAPSAQNSSAMAAYQARMTTPSMRLPQNINFQKGSGNAGNAIRFVLKKRGEPVGELRREPVTIPLVEIPQSETAKTSDLDPRQSRFIRKEQIQFSAALPAFGSKELVSNKSENAKGKIVERKAKSNEIVKEKRTACTNEEKRNDPRIHRSESRSNPSDPSTGDGLQLSIKLPQVSTPAALLTKPSTSLVSNLPDLSLDLPNICGNQSQTVHCFPPRLTRDPPKLPKLVRGNTYPFDKNCNLKSLDKDTSAPNSLGSTVYNEDRLKDPASTPGKNASALKDFPSASNPYVSEGNEKKQMKPLPKLTPAPGYTTR